MRLFDPDQHILSFKPDSGALLSDATARSYPSEWVYELHSRLLLGENGRWAIALDGVALLILAITGPFVWWPGRKHIRRALQVRWKGPPQRQVSELHRVCGVFLCAFIALTAITGVTLALMTEATRAVGAIAVVTPKPSLPNGPARLQSLAQTLDHAAVASQDRMVRSLRFPDKEMRVVRAILVSGGRPGWAIDEVWIDRSAGRVLQVNRAKAAPSGSRLLSWVLPVHAGFAFGWSGRFAVNVLAFMLAGFAGSGLWLWARRKFPRRKKKKGSSAPVVMQ